MASEYRAVPSNGFPCDFCQRHPVGWVRVPLPNRSTGGTRATEVYMVCDQHITLGESVYPVQGREGGGDDGRPT